VVEQPNGPVTVPRPERVRLVLVLAAGEANLEDDVAGRNGERLERVLERLLQLQRPALRALGDELRQPCEPRAPFRDRLEPR
jgi:hypothetical protein